MANSPKNKKDQKNLKTIIFLFLVRVWSAKDGGAGDGQKEGEEREGIQRKGEKDDKLDFFLPLLLMTSGSEVRTA